MKRDYILKSNYSLIASILVILTLSMTVTGEPLEQKTGSLKGVVTDANTGLPVIGATVMILDTQLGAATDENGRYQIAAVQIGTYSVNVRSIGFEPIVKTDVIIRAGRKSVMDAVLTESVTELKGQVVRADYFSQSETGGTSSISYSAEEVRRAPGSAGDVSRIMFTLPSIAKVNDQVNNLIVRGGSPTENSFYVDNIEIPNINHYPLFGTSGGPISLVNTDFIKDVTFSAGGFSAAYGDRLSSVMALSFREGDREQLEVQADMNFAGIGLTGEGPIAKGKGSWMLSLRRSYLDLLVEAIGTGVVPKYSDYQGKLVYDFSPKHRLSILGIAGVDYIDFDRESAIDEGNVTDGWSDGYEYAVGANWRYLWGAHGFSNTSVSYLATKAKSNYFETSTGNELVRQDNLDGAVQMRHVSSYRINRYHELEFGFDLKYELDRFDYYVSEYTDYFGNTIPSLTLDYEINSPKVGGFTNYTLRPSERFETTFGVRYDYFEYTDKGNLSPRLSTSYKFTDRTKINAAFGVYNQTLPIVLLSQQESNKELQNPKAYHYVLGLEHRLREDTRWTLEGYYKWYENFPMSTDEPQLFIIDEMVYSNYFQYHPNLVDNGNARSYGVETTVQRKLHEGIYGLVSAAWFRSQYEDLTGEWRNRAFDNRVIVSAEGGFKPNERWEFSLRWVFAGGPPRTPLDLTASELINRSVYDQSRVNELRYPDYHSLNLRVDRRFNFSNSNMILFFSVWNAYNRENVAQYYWNEVEKKPDEILQWSLLPIFGIEYEF